MKIIKRSTQTVYFRTAICLICFKTIFVWLLILIAADNNSSPLRQHWLLPSIRQIYDLFAILHIYFFGFIYFLDLFRLVTTAYWLVWRFVLLIVNLVYGFIW